MEKACAKIDKSTSWFYKAAENDTMTITDLEKLLKLCKMSLADFFSDQPINQVNEPQAKYGADKDEITDLLRENRKLRLRIEELERNQ